MKKCLYCGNDLPKEREKYCSRKCFDKHYHELNYVPKERKSHKYKCLFCGEEYEAKNLSKYCSESCRDKYNRRLKKKYCLNCNKEIDISKRKFCDDNCMNDYYTKHPKYTKTCVQCGTQFKTNTKSQKLCSTDCQHEYASAKDLIKREKEFKELFERLYTDYEYHSGFINRDSMFKCKCKKCGHIQERMAYYVQPSKDDYNIVCEGCNEIKKLKQSLVDLLARRHNTLVREQNRAAREEEKEVERQQRLEKLKGKICRECGQPFDAIRETQKYCTDECKKKYNNRVKEINRRHKLKKNGKINWDISLKKLIRRDKNICHICGDKCNSNDYTIDKDNNFIVGADYPSIDHITPVSKGGTHTWGNVKLAHHYCNTIKSDNDVYENREGQLKMSI